MGVGSQAAKCSVYGAAPDYDEIRSVPSRFFPNRLGHITHGHADRRLDCGLLEALYRLIRFLPHFLFKLPVDPPRKHASHPGDYVHQPERRTSVLAELSCPLHETNTVRRAVNGAEDLAAGDMVAA